MPIARAAREIGVDRSWAFKVQREGLLKSAQGSRPVLISPQELAALSRVLKNPARDA
jgi:hypothetical protein